MADDVDPTSPGPTTVVGSRFFPYGFKNESKELFKLAWPLTLSILFHYMIQPISLAFCGHLGHTELAAVALALSIIYITTISFGRGLAFGGDTFFSQTYGSANKMKMGIYLQKGLIFGLFTSFPIWALLLNAETLLLLIGQEPIVSRMAQEYVLLFMPGVLAYCWLFLLMRYLLCQNRVIPNFIICVIAVAINSLLHYGLLFQSGMGIKGSAIALAITYYMVLFMFVGYIWGSGIYRETWPGWSWECMEDWKEMGTICISSIAMTFIFWLCTEAGTFLAGALGEKEISAFSIMFQVEGFAWMIPLGLGGACSTRVGQFLGANDPLGALTSTRVTITITCLLSVILAGGCYGLKHLIPELFSTDREVIDYTAGLMPICAMFLLFEGFGGIGVGIVRGTGRQRLGTLIIFIAYYLVALPIGIPLLFATELKLAGLWWGYVIGLATQDLLLMIFIARISWVDEAQKAMVRAGVNYDPVISNADDPNPEANERTSLLGGATNIQHTTVEPSTNTSGTYQSSSTYDVIGQEFRPQGSRFKVLMQRLGIFSIFIAILVCGVLVRTFVHIEPKPTSWSELCIPNDNQSSIDFLATMDTSGVDANFILNDVMENQAEVNDQVLENSTQSFTTASPWVENSTLPYCNVTDDYDGAIHYLIIP